MSAATPALVRSGIITAETLHGSVPVTLTPVNPAPDISLIVLTDTLTPESVVSLRREISASFTSAFIAAHPLRIVTVSGQGGGVSSPLTNPLQLQAAVKSISLGQAANGSNLDLINTLGGVPASLPSSWAHAVILGRLPAIGADELWVAAWLGEIYRKQHVRVSFRSLDGTAPVWAQSLAGATSGTVATSDLKAILPLLSDPTPMFEATWEAKLPHGAWPYQTELQNAAGERITTFTSLATDPVFMPLLLPYLAARATLARSPATDEASARKVLEFNPGDVDALRRLAATLSAQTKPKEALDAWRQVSEILPRDAEVLGQLGAAQYSAGSFDDAEQTLQRARGLGLKTPETLATEARLHIRRNDYSGAIPMLEEALAVNKEAQPLWLLRADCGHQLKRWPIESESLEHALALGPIPLAATTNLIYGYLAAGQTDRAVTYLTTASLNLPPDAATRAQYAAFWEQAHNPAAAEPLWESSLTVAPTYQPAYLGLTQHYLDLHRNQDALTVADRGLQAIPKSVPLLAAKENVLESLGDLYGARRLLRQNIAASGDQIGFLSHRCQLEDLHGAGGAQAYRDLLAAQLKSDAPQTKVIETCRRGLLVAIRDEHYDLAKVFAERLASAGDQSGLNFLLAAKSSAADHTEIIGGADAFYFLLFGNGKAKPDRLLLDYARKLTTIDPHALNGKSEWQQFGQPLHEYFQRVAALVALGTRKGDHVEIPLTLADKPGKQRLEKAFQILGLKLKRNKDELTVSSAEGKKQAKKQDVLAALAIDEQAIQETLAKNKTYVLEVPVDSVPVYPSVDVWKREFYSHEEFPGRLAEAFLSDNRISELYLALNSMDRAAAQVLIAAVPLKTLADQYGSTLSAYAAALALTGTSAEVPGGKSATPIWEALSGASPNSPAAFFSALLRKDDGRLIAFFYTLSQLDTLHQRFFTRSVERTKRFYELFRSSAEMKRGGEKKLSASSFIEFLREVPLNADLSVDFPGAPEVWMVAKGKNISGSSVAKLTKNMKRKAAPDDEDEILIRLASTDYKSENRQQTELANFIAVTRVDAQRDEPLTPDSALLLAQGFATYGGLFPYFAELGNLDAADYKKAFSLEGKLSGIDQATANMRLGEMHAFLAMLGMLHEGGSVTPASVIELYRKGIDRYLAAANGSAWVIASLTSVDEMANYVTGENSRDSALRTLLLGKSSARREKAFNQILELQKVPSLDSLLTIWKGLHTTPQHPHDMDEIDRQLAALAVIDRPKNWHLTPDRKKSLELYDSGNALNIAAKMREKLGKRKPNLGDVNVLAGELMNELEPWTELALVGRIYARYLDPSDLLVSEDPLLLRKHEFINLAPRSGKVDFFTPSNLIISSDDEGSYFVGGLAEFSLSAGHARAAGNHLGGPSSEAFAGALFGSVRGTDWRQLTAAGMQSYGATIRLAREWIVESAQSEPMHRELEQESRGILSLTRRKALLEAVDRHDWHAVWDSASVSDLHFLGDELIERAPADLWKPPVLATLKASAAHSVELDLLGQVAPDLSGCAKPRLRRYEPYEEYQRHLFPTLLAERVSEMKLYLAWLADDSAWPPASVSDLAATVADGIVSKVQMRDSWDWSAALEAYRNLKPELLEPLITQP